MSACSCVCRWQLLNPGLKMPPCTSHWRVRRWNALNCLSACLPALHLFLFFPHRGSDFAVRLRLLSGSSGKSSLKLIAMKWTLFLLSCLESRKWNKCFGVFFLQIYSKCIIYLLHSDIFTTSQTFYEWMNEGCSFFPPVVLCIVCRLTSGCVGFQCRWSAGQTLNTCPLLVSTRLLLSDLWRT